MSSGPTQESYICPEDCDENENDWENIKAIGSGGFGVVNLWVNNRTGSQIAVKTIRVPGDMSPKHRERWIIEVNLMRKLDHPNVIKALDVPKCACSMPNDLPPLGMEYCKGGDLRKILTLPENCCGLREFEIRGLVRDIASAIEYLHGKKIIHRDLKPENIVMQPTEDQTLYKLIDLGYAKELDQNSVCKSFVGTLQYLAPELVAVSQVYTCTADYWSFGTVVFECICGFRPFLPHFNLVPWHREIQKKTDNDICAISDDSGEVQFLQTLPQPNYLGSVLKSYFEGWLKLMLKWDPKTRGGGMRGSRPACFHMLERLMKVKIVNILHVEANELLSFPIQDGMTIQELQGYIEQRCRIAPAQQELLLATGATLEQNQQALHCWAAPGEEEWVIFLFRKGRSTETSLQQKRYKSLPRRVHLMARDMDTLLPYQEQKRSWAEAVFFCTEQSQDYKRLLLSQRAITLSLLRAHTTFLNKKTEMVKECDHLMAKMSFFRDSLDHDVDSYQNIFMSATHSSPPSLTAITEVGQKGSPYHYASEGMVNRWQEAWRELEEFYRVKEECSHLDSQACALQTKILELQRSPFSRMKQSERLVAQEKEARELYQQLRLRKDSHPTVQTPIIKIVLQCIRYRDSGLDDLYVHLNKICSCKEELQELMPKIKDCRLRISTANQQLISAQKERQTDIWMLMSRSPKNGFTVINRQMSDGADGMEGAGPDTGGDNSPLDSLQVMKESDESIRKFSQLMSSVIEEYSSLIDWDSLKDHND